MVNYTPMSNQGSFAGRNLNTAEIKRSSRRAHSWKSSSTSHSNASEKVWHRHSSARWHKSLLVSMGCNVALEHTKVTSLLTMRVLTTVTGHKTAAATEREKAPVPMVCRAVPTPSLPASAENKNEGQSNNDNICKNTTIVNLRSTTKWGTSQKGGAFRTESVFNDYWLL